MAGFLQTTNEEGLKRAEVFGMVELRDDGINGGLVVF